jgi:hypothetical protein
MPKMQYKNLWGSKDSGYDQQRADLFKVQIHLPRTLGGITNWSNDVEFAVTKFPFPDRKREVLPIKYLNMTNFQLGADTATGPIEIPVRYAFNQATALVLERWHQLTSNPRTGGVSQTTLIKANGEFWWLIPNQPEMDKIAQQETEAAMRPGLKYVLEGCLITGLKPSQADMTATGDAALTMLDFTLNVDRYYPVNINNMVFGKSTA